VYIKCISNFCVTNVIYISLLITYIIGKSGDLKVAFTKWSISLGNAQKIKITKNLFCYVLNKKPKLVFFLVKYYTTGLGLLVSK
jgi:hypothetical protein